jgi:hypothetical protein
MVLLFKFSTIWNTYQCYLKKTEQTDGSYLKFSTIWNTYQCYLKKTEEHVLADTRLAATLGFR